jgi:hypothetical protein
MTRSAQTRVLGKFLNKDLGRSLTGSQGLS